MALPMMTQTELIRELAERTGWTNSDVKRLLAEIDEVVVENLGNCIRTKVGGVVIEPKLKAKRKARMGRNPATGEAVRIAAKAASVKIAARVPKSLQSAAPSVKKLQSAL